MKFKLDENLGARTQTLLLAAGHDVETVRSENLGGASDQRIYEAFLKEKRCLVTLDLDFANVVRFPTRDTAGVVVIRTPVNPSLAVLERMVAQLLEALTRFSGDHFAAIHSGGPG